MYQKGHPVNVKAGKTEKLPKKGCEMRDLICILFIGL
jgi:hypothetical protein